MSVVMTATPSVNPSDPNTIDWTLCNVSVSPNRCGTGKTDDPYPIIDLPYKSGPQDVIFVINDQHQLGVKFASNALWMTPGKGIHPTNPSIQSNGQVSVGLGYSSVLVVHDKNDNPAKQDLWLSYRLNFVNSNNQAVSSIDPDWHNGGTGSTPNTLGTVSLVIGTATLVTVLYVAYQQSALKRMLSGRRPGTGENLPG